MGANIFRAVLLLVWVGLSGFMYGVQTRHEGWNRAEKIGGGAWLFVTGLFFGAGIMHSFLA
ncbi:unnamed protein product [marine sediment metagenome]|uniref:Uncharacterized protein n=1 Tax=marine sediment metagenome TaxID=412755 RepID=X1F8P7_9ZZZZ